MRTRYLLAGWLLASVAVQAETFACDLKALSTEQRKVYQQLNKGLAAAVTGVKELPDGYTFQIDSGKLGIVDIAQWITLERRCCPFLIFRLDVGKTGDIVGLSLQGAPGVKKFIETEFRM